MISFSISQLLYLSLFSYPFNLPTSPKESICLRSSRDHFNAALKYVLGTPPSSCRKEFVLDAANLMDSKPSQLRPAKKPNRPQWFSLKVKWEHCALFTWVLWKVPALIHHHKGGLQQDKKDLSLTMSQSLARLSAGVKQWKTTGFS